MPARTDELRRLSAELRLECVRMSHESETAHLGGSLSCVDLLVALYWARLRVDPRNPTDDSRDRLVMSKGHAAMALFSALAYRGFFPRDLLRGFARHGSPLEEHPGWNCVPGVETASGSLGHGLPVGAGMALAAKIRRMDYQVFVLMSDGECNEGSVWEAAMFAPAKGLDNLVAVVDVNGWQATGRSDQVLALQPLADKWRAFGWDAREVDGHDMDAIVDILQRVPAGKPSAVLAKTVKGKGVSFMEDDNNWHYRIPTAAEVEAARVELLSLSAPPPDVAAGGAHA